MARKPETAPKPPKPRSLKPLLWVCMLSMVIFAFPESIILLFLGLLPTLVALIIDKSKRKYSTFCVGGMNITGVFPSMLELWAGANDISHAIEIITNVFDLAVMYFAASFGWLLYIAIPPVVNSMLAVVAQHRIAQLRGRQRELIKEWGDGIAVDSQETGDADKTSKNGAEKSSGNGAQSAPPPPSDIEELEEVPPAPS